MQRPHSRCHDSERCDAAQRCGAPRGLDATTAPVVPCKDLRPRPTGRNIRLGWKPEESGSGRPGPPTIRVRGVDRVKVDGELPHRGRNLPRLQGVNGSPSNIVPVTKLVNVAAAGQLAVDAPNPQPLREPSLNCGTVGSTPTRCEHACSVSVDGVSQPGRAPQAACANLGEVAGSSPAVVGLTDS